MIDPETSLNETVRAATERALSAEEAEWAFTEVMEGRTSAVQTAALLVAIRVRGAVAEEVAGGVRALRRAMIAVPAPSPRMLIDTCGTGGGAVTTFNISTAAAFVAAGAGVRIAKHGNRSFTSRCGSADVLEALGVRLDLTPEQEAEVLAQVGIVFMFAPLHHPAMRHVAPVRRELAMSTVMNILGPLTNPAGAARQIVGVANPEHLELIANALRVLGHERALVVHGEPGMDEISPVGATEIWELNEGEVKRWTWDAPAEMGWSDRDLPSMGGGDPHHNARLLREIVGGERGGAGRAAVIANAGAAIYLAGLAPTLREGAELATRAVNDGSALQRLEAFREATQKVAEG